jgi:hypothetical protein
MALPRTGSNDSSARYRYSKFLIKLESNIASVKYLYFHFYSLKITNSNCSDDETAIRIGQLYIDIKNKSEFDLNEKLEQIKILEKEKAHQDKVKQFRIVKSIFQLF